MDSSSIGPVDDAADRTGGEDVDLAGDAGHDRLVVLARWLTRWGWLIMLAAGISLFAAVQQAVLATGNPNLVPALILLGATTVPASFTCLAALRAERRTVGTGALLSVAVVGGIAGLVSASLAEYRVDVVTGGLPAVAVAVVEEAVKLIAPFVLFLVVGRRTTVVDGFVIGIASSAGFAALETMGYAAVAFIQVPHLSGLRTVDQLLLWRGLLSPAGHMAWTGMTATALWWAVHRRWAARATLRFLAAFVIAVALHAVWDSVDTLPAYLVLAVVGLGLLGYTARRARISASVLRGEPSTSSNSP